MRQFLSCAGVHTALAVTTGDLGMCSRHSSYSYYSDTALQHAVHLNQDILELICMKPYGYMYSVVLNYFRKIERIQIIQPDILLVIRIG